MRAEPARLTLLSDLVEGAPDGVLVVARDGRVIQVNRQAEVLFGYERAQLLGQKIEGLVPDSLHDFHVNARTSYARNPKIRPMGDVGRTLLAKRRDGTQFPVEISLAPIETPDGPAVSAFVRDATPRAELESELVRLALHDSLTGLPNRTLLLDRLTGTLARDRRRGTITALLFVDIDQLKWINDSLGHDAGDTFIRTIGERMAAHVRPSDTVARFGGDEFIVLIEDVSGPAEAIDLTERLLQFAHQPLALAGREVRPTISIGITLSRESATSDRMIQEADDAMYRAKRHGGDRAELFRDEWRADALRALDLRTALTRDIGTGAVGVHYQPIVDLVSGALWGAEALLRWGPNGALLPAYDVVQLAEQSRLVLDLDRVVTRSACVTLARFAKEADLRLGVNVSMRHLPSGDLPGLVAEALDASGLPPDRLWVELTESVDLASDEAARILKSLRGMGVRVAIDDFGTGFSSLSRLRDLPVDMIKIDRSFTCDVETDARNRALIAAVVDLAHALGLEVFAEGVEREAQRGVLLDLGCDYGQGFLWSPALSEAGLGEWARDRAERTLAG